MLHQKSSQIGTALTPPNEEKHIYFIGRAWNQLAIHVEDSRPSIHFYEAFCNPCPTNQPVLIRLWPYQPRPLLYCIVLLRTK